MRQITKADYEKIHTDFRDVWTTEREDWPDWAEVRHQYMGKRTLMEGGNGGCHLLIEGLHFEIIDNPKQKGPRP